MPDCHDITALLGRWAQGDQRAFEHLTESLSAELRRLAAGYLRRERPDHTLQPTALVNEAYVRLLGQKQTPSLQNRSQFFTIAAHLMRQILVDHARRRQASKRSGQKVPLNEAINLPDGRIAELLMLDEALKTLEQVDARKSKTIELHYFGGLSLEEISEALQISTRTVSRELAFSEAWLRRQFRETGQP